MAVLARNLLKFIVFLMLFYTATNLEAPYLSNHPVISFDTAVTVASWISSNPTPEDIYFVFDYVSIAIRLLMAVVFYSVLFHFIRNPIFNNKNRQWNSLAIVKGVVIRILKIALFTFVFIGVLNLMPYDEFIMHDNPYGIGIVTSINAALSISIYYAVIMFIRKRILN